jgi:hypothetical protein
MSDLLAMIGLVLLLEGLPYFVSPRGMKRLMAQIPDLSDGTLRLWGVTAMLGGLLLVYLGR